MKVRALITLSCYTANKRINVCEKVTSAIDCDRGTDRYADDDAEDDDDWLIELRFYVPPDTKQVISETFFAAKLLAQYWRN